MDFSTMGSRVQALLNEVPSSYGAYTSAMLSAFLNEANLDVAMDAGLLDAQGQVDTVSGTNAYALSASYMCPNYLSIRAIFWNGKKLNPTTFDDPMWSYGDTIPTGDPNSYRIWRDKIELIPSPTTAEALVAYYFKPPDTMVNATATSDVPAQYHMAVVFLAAAYISVKNDDELKENKFYQMYLRRRERLRKLDMNFDKDKVPVDNFYHRRAR